jgi:hypothetical protein
LVRAGGGELALHQIRCRALFGITSSGHDEPASSTRTAKSCRPHQPGDALATDPLALVAQLGVNVGTAVIAVGGEVDPANPLGQQRILPSSARGDGERSCQA